jgi:Flp pilus assembly protein TadD
MNSETDGVHDEATAALQGGDPGQAVAVLTPWLALHPDDATAWQLMTTAHCDLGEWAQAWEAAVKTVRLRRDDPQAYCELGMVLTRLGRLSEVRAAVRRALTLHPTHPRAVALKAELDVLHQPAEGPILRDRFLLP